MKTYLINYDIGQSDDYMGSYSKLIDASDSHDAVDKLNKENNGYKGSPIITSITLVEEVVNIEGTRIDDSIDVRYEGDLIKAFNKFIEKWCGNWYSHLIDTDENDGQFIRDKIDLLIGFKESPVEVESDKFLSAEIRFNNYSGKLNKYFTVSNIGQEDNDFYFYKVLTSRAKEYLDNRK